MQFGLEKDQFDFKNVALCLEIMKRLVDSITEDIPIDKLTQFHEKRSDKKEKDHVIQTMRHTFYF